MCGLSDGRSIYAYFEGRIAAEIRLWEAIERKLLSPFHYFGVTDNVDLSQVRWVAGKYDEREIESLFVFERAVAVKRVGNVMSITHLGNLMPLEVALKEDLKLYAVISELR